MQREVLRGWDPNVDLMSPVGAHWVAEPRPRQQRREHTRVMFAHSGEEGLTAFVQSVARMAVHHGDQALFRVRPHPMTLEKEIQGLGGEWQVSRGPLADDLAWADVVYCEQSTICFDALVAGCEVRIFGDVTLASILGLRPLPPLCCPGAYRALPPATDGWPFERISEDALEHLVHVLARQIECTKIGLEA